MSTYQNLLNNYTRGYLGFSTLGVMVQSCVGGLAAMAILMHGNSVAQMIQLFLAVVVCVSYNGALLSQLPAKITFNLFWASCIINTVLFVANLI